MNEISVEGQKLDALARHLNAVGTEFLEPYLKLLDSHYEASRIPYYGGIPDTGGFTSFGETAETPHIEKEHSSDFDALRETDGFFADLGKRDGTFAKTSAAECGGSGAPWAEELAASWNSAIDSRATDLHGVIFQTYLLSDAVIAAFESYEDVDLYNEQGIRRTTEQS